MAKKGMKRPQETHVKPHNKMPPVPELKGSAKHGGKANPIIAGTASPSQKVFHAVPHSKKEKPVSSVYPVIDNDLARDNAENDLTATDLQDM